LFWLYRSSTGTFKRRTKIFLNGGNRKILKDRFKEKNGTM